MLTNSSDHLFERMLAIALCLRKTLIQIPSQGLHPERTRKKKNVDGGCLKVALHIDSIF